MSLPELPTDPSTTFTTTGHARTVQGRTMVILPYAAPVGPSRGRRYRIETAYGPAFSRVILSIGGQAAMRPPDQIPLHDGEQLAISVRALPERPTQRIPADLRRALTTAELRLDGLDESAVRHLLSMVAEAHDPEIRAARVTAAVQAAQLMHGVQS